MIWARSGRMHWTNQTGRLMFDVRVLKEASELTMINAETGEIMHVSKHAHPLDAMSNVREVIKHEEIHASYKEISEATASTSHSPTTERRARYKKVIENYASISRAITRGSQVICAGYDTTGKDSVPFDQMLAELQNLPLKCLQQLAFDLHGGYTKVFSGDHHGMLVSHVETSIIERTILK